MGNRNDAGILVQSKFTQEVHDALRALEFSAAVGSSARMMRGRFASARAIATRWASPPERMTPVLMTALSAGFALLPLMVDATAPGKEVLHPVAITIFGGLICATLLDAVLTPILFLQFGEKPLARLIEGAERNRPRAPRGQPTPTNNGDRT